MVTSVEKSVQIANTIEIIVSAIYRNVGLVFVRKRKSRLGEKKK